MINVAFNDLKRHHAPIRQEIDQAISTVIDTSAFVRGRHVEEFEGRFAELTGQKHVVSCSDGTTALYIAMRALGAGPGDEVIVPGMSWISTSETVSQTGATVIFCDISPDTHVIDAGKIEELVTDRTVGIIPVHLYGHPAPMPAIMEIAKKNALWVIEDCAQAHLATIDDKMIGSFGNIASYSFYPGKNLGAMGDAGALTTNDGQLAEMMTKFARHGGLRKGEHDIEGINSRLDGLQAAILNVKIEHLPRWTEKRRAIAERYMNALSGLNSKKISIPYAAENCNPAWHLFVVQTEDRQSLIKHLQEKEIQTVINYPKALPFLPCYSGKGHTATDFPNSHYLQNTCLSIPIFPEIEDQEIEAVVHAISTW